MTGGCAARRQRPLDAAATLLSGQYSASLYRCSLQPAPFCSLEPGALQPSATGYHLTQPLCFSEFWNTSSYRAVQTAFCDNHLKVVSAKGC